MLCVLNRPPYANRRQCPQDSGAQRRYGCRAGHSRRTDGSWRRICPYGRAAKGRKAVETTKKQFLINAHRDLERGLEIRFGKQRKRKVILIIGQSYHPQIADIQERHRMMFTMDNKFVDYMDVV